MIIFQLNMFGEMFSQVHIIVRILLIYMQLSF